MIQQYCNESIVKVKKTRNIMFGKQEKLLPLAHFPLELNALIWTKKLHLITLNPIQHIGLLPFIDLWDMSCGF